jgi:hypothetical protein
MRTGRAFALLAATAALALAACGTADPTASGLAGDPGGGSQPGPTTATSRPVTATTAEVFADRPLFGVHLDESTASLADVTKAARCQPTMSEVFASVADGISTKTLQSMPGLPVLSVEPWHPNGQEEQADFTLRATIDGRWDGQYRKIADAVVRYQQPILIRFAHEMNGHWYPWGVTNGNQPGEYIKAFQHVVDIFRAKGATNALWVWSPNIIRGASSSTLAEFWPGEKYVDIVGLTGYGVRESSPDITYQKTLALVTALTDKPIVLTEVGVQPDPTKEAWITAFGPWLKAHPQVAGFVWNEAQRQGDWRFDDDSQDAAAFTRTLAAAGVSC